MVQRRSAQPSKVQPHQIKEEHFTAEKLIMCTVPALERTEGNGSSCKTGLFLLLFGVSFLSAGVIIATVGYQSCDHHGGSCNMTLKATGPSLCGIALLFILLSRSRTLINLRQLANSADRWCYLSCSKQDSFIRFLIFGVLFCFSGVLLTMIGVWAITCPGIMEGQGFNLTSKANGNEKCKLLFLQIMGPVVTFIGICFLLIAHFKRKVALSAEEESTSTNDQQPQRTGPCQIAIDNSMVVLPPPPPYFREPPPIVNDCSGACHPPPSENPPSYYSVVFCRSQTDENSISNMTDGRLIVTVSSALPYISGACCFPSDLPPMYEEKDPQTSAEQPTTSSNNGLDK